MESNSKSKGCVYLVGAGPGDPELLTLKGKRLIESCDDLVYDNLVDQRILDWAPEGVRRHYVGKQSGFHALPQEEICDLLVSLADQGRMVVRLKGGDPFIFGRGGEEALALREAGIRYEVVPAVTAALGCAAYSGIPLTHRDLSATVIFASGHEMPEKSEDRMVNWRKLAAAGGTLVLYMAMGRLDEICRELIAGGRTADTPASVIEWGTTPRQRNLSGTLKDIAERSRMAEMKPPAVVIIGEVANLGQTLGWYDI